MAKILVVDDEVSIIDVVRTLLKQSGHEVLTSENSDNAAHLLSQQSFDLLIVDLHLPGQYNGIELLKLAKNKYPNIIGIVMTAYVGVDHAVEAMKNGAFDFVTKPFRLNLFLDLIKRALSSNQIIVDEHTGIKKYFGLLIGESGVMKHLYSLIEKVAKTNSLILITGESGTGKELVAKAIHQQSACNQSPFISINCAAMPENLLESELFGYEKGAFTGADHQQKGLFEAAEDGTLFLDEIGSITPTVQAKLLRVLQEHEIRRIGATHPLKIRCRILAATNENLEEKVKNHLFREDLFFRLSVIPIQLPPLRDRAEDILPLTLQFLYRFEKNNGIVLSIDPSALELLRLYPWPGNIRQLENILIRTATLAESKTITIEDLPDEIKNYKKEEHADSKEAFLPITESETKIIPLKEYLHKIEILYIHRIIANSETKEDAAKKLGISVATLYRKLDQEDLL